MRLRFSTCLLSLLALALAIPLFAQDWPQWVLNAQHTGQSPFTGQNLNQNIVNLVYDPLVPDEQQGSLTFFGSADLLAHYQAPLVDGNDVYMMFKSGSYNPRNYASQK